MVAVPEFKPPKRPTRQKAKLRSREAQVLDIVEGPGWDRAMGRMIAVSPIFFAQEVLTGAPEAPYYGRYLVGDHHLEWDQLVVAHDRVCVLAPRDHGKCAVGSSLVLAEDGRRVRLDEWPGGHLLAFDPETHCWRVTYAPPSRPNGVKSVLRVRTRTGREVVVTENHPLRIWSEWRRADELVVGDRIAVPRRLPIGSERIPDSWLIGLLVGDGGLTGSNVVLTTSDPEIVSAAAEFAEVRQADAHSWRLLGLQPRMRELGLMGESSHTKRVPEIFFQADARSLGEFLGGYLDADGSVNPHGGGSVEYYSVSESLLRDIQHLLLRLNIVSVLSPKKGRYRGQVHWSWRLTIRGKDLEHLAEVVHLEGNRRNDLQVLALSQKSKGKCSGPAVDRFPVDVWDLTTKSEDWFRKRGLPRPSKAYEPTREKVRNVGLGEDNPSLLQAAGGDVLWDEVVDIEPLGERETWSLMVPELNNYVADDVVNHNTFFFDFALPLWKAVTMPGGIGFLFSATKEQAKLILDDIKVELETNPRLQHLVPSRRNKWRSDAIRLTNGHTIYARGYGTKVRGRHPHYIVCDDILNDETAYSEVIRQKEEDYFFTAITNMIRPYGSIYVIGTPFHKLDLYAKLKKNPQYVFRQYQATRPDGSVLWEDRYDKARLADRREEIGPIRFAREFQCEPVADDMSLFPSGLFVGDPIEQFTVCLGEPLERWIERGVTPYIGVDVAMSTSVKADYMVIWCMGNDARGNRWIIDIDRARGVSFQEQLSRIVKMARRYDPAMIFIEDNQMQRVWGDELIRTTDLPIKKFTTTAVAKNALDKGVPGLRVLLENAKFRIPRGDRRSVEETDIWIEEMRSFTWHDGKLQSVGGHDDTVMGCWICDQAIRLGGFSFSMGGEDEDMTIEEMVAEMTGAKDDEGNGGDLREVEDNGSNLVDSDSGLGLSLPAILGVM